MERFVRTDLAVEGACTFKLIEETTDTIGTSVELFNLLKSYPAPTIPQITVSRSHRNTIRGLHCSPHHKLVSCPTGKAFDVIVDLRRNSPTFMKWTAAWLDRTTNIVIPPYCAHGFFAAEEDTSILYIQGGCFAAELDFSLRWDDPTAHVDWPKPIDADDYIISAKDRANPLANDETFDKIVYRIEHHQDTMKLCPFADFAIIADTNEYALPVFEACGNQNTTAHYCYGGGLKRDTLEGEFIALRPGKSVIMAANTHKDKANTFLDIMNVVHACFTRGFHVTIVTDQLEFPCSKIIVDTLTKEAKNLLFIACNSAPTPAIASKVVEMAKEQKTGFYALVDQDFDKSKVPAYYTAI